MRSSENSSDGDLGRIAIHAALDRKPDADYLREMRRRFALILSGEKLS